MAIKYYGSCTGTSSGKYDLWMSVTQNSQNISSNTSNLTVKVFLKRNDGYSASAYNHIQSDNSIKISVGGTNKVNKNITVDTRNNVTVTLGEWTGNVTHNADGSLSVAVGAVFTMGNTTLSGGTIKGTFKCTTIPRASSMSFSASSVNPGSTVEVNISSASKIFTHRVIWGVGSKKSSVDLAANVTSYSLDIPVQWASQLTDATKGALDVALKTYNKGVLIGTVNYNISFVIPQTDDYKPDFNISIERLDNNAPSSWEEYVKGVSQLKVDISDAIYKYDAKFSAVSVTVGSITKRAVPCVFDLTVSGEVAVSVTVRDTRGLSRKKTTKISVCDYSPPYVNIKSITRCNEDGTNNPRGTYLSMDYDVGYSDVNSKNSCKVVLKYRKTKTQYYGDSLDVSGTPFVFGDGNISESSSYVVSVTVSDDVLNYNEVLCSVTVADIPFNIRKGGKGAAFGKFAENDNELSVAWDLNISGNLTVSGELNYEEVVCEATELSQNIIQNTRYYPALQLVWLGIRLDASKALSANATHTVARVSVGAPSFFTPLQSVVHFSSGVKSEGGILNTGEIVFRSDEAIEAGTQIYISGAYIITR